LSLSLLCSRHSSVIYSAGWLPQQLQQQLRSFSVVSGDDSHDDFKPKYKQEPVGDGDVDAVIKHDINSNKVFIYMKVRIGLLLVACCLRDCSALLCCFVYSSSSRRSSKIVVKVWL
jgi:hypothetical protein